MNMWLLIHKIDEYVVINPQDRYVECKTLIKGANLNLIQRSISRQYFLNCEPQHTSLFTIYHRGTCYINCLYLITYWCVWWFNTWACIYVLMLKEQAMYDIHISLSLKFSFIQCLLTKLRVICRESSKWPWTENCKYCKMPSPFQIFSQSDYLIQIVHINSHT